MLQGYLIVRVAHGFFVDADEGCRLFEAVIFPGEDPKAKINETIEKQAGVDADCVVSVFSHWTEHTIAAA